MRARDTESAHNVLTAAGYSVETLRGESVELRDPKAIDHPDDVASLLVNSGFPPTHLTVEEEELEDYFLRLVGTSGERK